MVQISAEKRITNGAFWSFKDIISALHLRNGEPKGVDDVEGIAVAAIRYNDLASADKFLVESYADEIACHIAPDSLLVQLGSNMHKIGPLLDALKARHGSFKYAVVDESATAPKDAEIRNTTRQDWAHLDAVKLIETNYSNGLKELRQQHPDSVICVIWDGSSVGELLDTEAVQFLKSVTEAVGSRCQVVWFTELRENENASKNDEKSIAAHAIKEGLRNVLDSLGYEASPDDEKSWIYQIDLNRKLKQVETYLCFSKGLKGVDGQMSIRPGERFLVGISQRFTAEDLIHLASMAFFQVHAAWHDNSNGCQILVPVQEALRCCWKDTDIIFELLSNWMRKPIEFRHPYCFYYGHIMAFANLKLFDGEPPSSFDIMFSRGMDPIVVDPLKCHAHPGAPRQWPDIDTLKAYVLRTRDKIMDAVESGLLGMRALTFALEHERMHQETLMYMVVQQRKADFERTPYTDYQVLDSPLLVGLTNLTLSSGTPDIFVSPGKVCLGANFRETVFLWDNEYPILDAVVEKPILVSSNPVTVKEFLKFTLEGGYDKEHLWQPADFAFFHQQRLSCPATWSLVAGDYYVHYAEKTIHWSKVAEQPVFVSLSEAEAFCSWVGCRVMTESEYQRILDCDNDGRVKQLRTGGWEWTSTIFAPFPGFEPMPMYPEYSADFFDGSHYVLKGSSSSTHPSMHRDTFRNFYQRQYPYIFAKFRCCKSIQ